MYALGKIGTNIDCTDHYMSATICTCVQLLYIGAKLLISTKVPLFILNTVSDNYCLYM